MVEDGADIAEEDGAEASSPSAPRESLESRLAKLTRRLEGLIDSGEVDSALRKAMMVNAVRHGDRRLSARDADVVEMLVKLAPSLALSRLAPVQVACLPRLERAGFVTVKHRVVRLSPRGRALGAARAHERNAIKVELGRLRDSLAKYSM